MRDTAAARRRAERLSSLKMRIEQLLGEIESFNEEFDRDLAGVERHVKAAHDEVRHA